jgi:antitoxin component YwqK of YwqJK toxin-antitoxin module
MYTRFTLLLSLCIALSIPGSSQTRQYLYYLDRDLVSVEKSNAFLLGKGQVDGNNFKLMCYDLRSEKLVMILFFKDSTIATFNGPFLSFYSNGKTENRGNFADGREEGIWQKWDSTGNLLDSIDYRLGKVILNAHYNYFKDAKVQSYSIADSIDKTAEYKDYDSTGRPRLHATVKNQRGVLVTFENGVEKREDIFTGNDREAEFPGGTKGWTGFLRQNLNANVPVDNGAKEGTWQVLVRFTVKQDGSIEDITAETNHGHGMEQEVISTIKKGPKWIPAIRFGKTVDSYRRQPATFVVSEK